MYERFSLAVGSLAPELTLKDESGKDVSLREIRRGNKLVLAFVRGVDDSHTREQLDYLKDDIERFRLRGARIVAVTPGGIEFARVLHKALKLPFPLLSDPGCRAVKEYGLYNEYEQIVGPAVFILNEAGILLFTYVGQNPSDIVEDEELLKTLESDTQVMSGPPA